MPAPNETEMLEHWAVDAERREAFHEALDLWKAALTARRSGKLPYPFIHTLSRLVIVHSLLGQYDEADALVEEGRQLFLGGVSKGHPAFLDYLEASSFFDETRGFLHGSFLTRTLMAEIARAVCGPNDLRTAAALRERASCELQTGMLDEANGTLREAFRIVLDSGTVDPPTAAAYMSVLASVKVQQGDYEAALPMIEDCLTILDPQGGARTQLLRDLATSLVGLGRLHEAAAALEEVSALNRGMKSAKARITIPPLAQLAVIRAAFGEWDEALRLAREVESLWQHQLDFSSSLGTDESRGVFAQSMRDAGAPTLALFLAHAGTGSGTAAAECLELVWRRKGIATASLAAWQRKLHETSAARPHELYRQWRGLQSEIAAAWLEQKRVPVKDSGVGPLFHLVERSDQLEKQISAALDGIRKPAADPTSVGNVAANLPDQSVLIEYVRACRFDPANCRNQLAGGDAYFAFAVRAEDSGGPRLYDLGPAEEIEGLIARLETRIVPGAPLDRGPDAMSLSGVLGALEDKLLGPLVREMGGVRHLVIVPDSELARVPFAALRDRAGTYLCERFLVSYAGVGSEVARDWVRAPRAGERTQPVVIAAPAFSDASPSAGEIENGLRLGFSPLPHSLREARSIVEELGSGTRLYVGSDADKRALLGCESPEILHLATHGFVFPGSQDWESSFELGHALRDSSLLRSGIGLAGAQTYLDGRPLPPNQGNGVATALEIAGMNLHATELAVLSACKSGLGDVRTGEAVYGLRRAFFVAGARRLLISLWNVSDVRTADLMTSFYQRLKRGETPAEALSGAQADVRLVTPHPYYWAAFALFGDPRAWK